MKGSFPCLPATKTAGPTPVQNPSRAIASAPPDSPIPQPADSTSRAGRTNPGCDACTMPGFNAEDVHSSQRSMPTGAYAVGAHPVIGLKPFLSTSLARNTSTKAGALIAFRSGRARRSDADAARPAKGPRYTDVKEGICVFSTKPGSSTILHVHCAWAFPWSVG